MRTRRGLCYPRVFGAVDSTCSEKKRVAGDYTQQGGEQAVPSRGRRRRILAEGPNLFDKLPDDLVLCVLSKLSATASCPSDFISVLLT